jgi:hypothetical protein
MDTITEFVGKDCTYMVYALDMSSTSISGQQTKIEAERTAILDVIDTSMANTSAGVISASILENGYYTIYSDFGSYNPYWGLSFEGGIYVPNLAVTTHDPATLLHWVIDLGTSYSLTNLETSGASAFTCDGDMSGTLPPTGSTIIWLNNDEWARVVITEVDVISGGGGMDDTTYIGVSAETLGNAIPSGITDVLSIDTTYDYTSSIIETNYPEITAWIADFDFALDHLTMPIGVSGIYGINGKWGAMNKGKATVDTNKSKQDAMDSHYRKYTQWTKVLDNTDAGLPDVTFYDDGSDTTGLTTTTFTCSGDMTGTLIGGSTVTKESVSYQCYVTHTSSATNEPGKGVDWSSYWKITQTGDYASWTLGQSYISGRDILCDCGVDKVKGGKVGISTYIPISAASYTECTIVANMNEYLNSPTLSASILAMSTSAMNIMFDEDFLTATIYHDTVSIGTSAFSCILDHTSSATNEPGTGINWETYWEAITVNSPGAAWVSGVYYRADGAAPLSGVIRVDDVTFRCPGDLTSELASGAVLMCAFDDEYTTPAFTPRFFTVYYSEYLSDPLADTTKVTISDGLPITQNITSVSIVPT